MTYCFKIICWCYLLSNKSLIKRKSDRKWFEKHPVGSTNPLRQPETEEEIEQAINAIAVSCVSAVRYGGTDPKIIKRLYSLNLESECDYKLKV
jgi:hypothetical protein